MSETSSTKPSTRRRGRPPANEGMSDPIATRLTLEQRDFLDVVCWGKGWSLAEGVREVFAVGSRVLASDPDWLADVAADMRKKTTYDSTDLQKTSLALAGGHPDHVAAYASSDGHDTRADT